MNSWFISAISSQMGKKPRFGGAFLWHNSFIVLQKGSKMAIEIKVLRDKKLGTWRGLGGAISEATAYNFSKLSPERQQGFLRAYYSEEGLNYSWGRLSIGSNDFCLKPYEYTKRGDMSDFSIVHDEKWVIPMLHAIQKFRKKQGFKEDLTYVASPWSPPSHMKTTHMTRFGGSLAWWKYKAYTDYLRRWYDAYAERGIKIRYLSPQNEPHAVQLWESCVYTATSMKRLTYKYLAKEFKDTDLQFLLWDHNKPELSKVAFKLFHGSYVTEYGKDKQVAGLCYHWYRGTHPEQMWHVREKYPDILLISSEMCCGFSPYNKDDWQNDARYYLGELFHDINCGAAAFIDWNMLLDYSGGPSYCHNNVKSPVILNEKSNDFILSPIYDALKKFAKAFPIGSEVVRCEFAERGVVAIARGEGENYTVVLANVTSDEREAVVRCGEKEKTVLLRPTEVKAISF